MTFGDAGYQSDWFDILQATFMRHAFIGGSLVALAAGMLGYFVVVRRQAFAAHALAHIGFPGATLAALIGIPITFGLGAFCIAGALAIAVLGREIEEREIATGTILAFSTGLGLLFSSLATQNTRTITNVLFGNLLAVTTAQLTTFAAVTVGVAVVLLVVGRPLTFASVDPQVAEAKGVPVKALGIVFLVLLALVVTIAVQVVGTLLLFALVVTPSATALLLTARPAAVALLGTGVALGSVWLGLVLSVMFNLPPSFFIVATSFVVWLIAVVWDRRRRANLTAIEQPVDRHHPVHASVVA
ncbi:MAG TPA: metal ABC transporter permease [Acidimicrobiales bacterium]|nr:metal ABC transporter permease [Acidimicrobiales bacterium]